MCSLPFAHRLLEHAVSTWLLLWASVWLRVLKSSSESCEDAWGVTVRVLFLAWPGPLVVVVVAVTVTVTGILVAAPN